MNLNWEGGLYPSCSIQCNLQVWTSIEQHTLCYNVTCTRKYTWCTAQKSMISLTNNLHLSQKANYVFAYCTLDKWCSIHTCAHGVQCTFVHLQCTLSQLYTSLHDQVLSRQLCVFLKGGEKAVSDTKCHIGRDINCRSDAARAAWICVVRQLFCLTPLHELFLWASFSDQPDIGVTPLHELFLSQI